MPDPTDAPRSPDPATTCARPLPPPPGNTPPLAPPLQLSSVYQFLDLDHVDDFYEGRMPGFVYARDGNPNAQELAQKVAALEGGESALVFGSGMGAEAALMLGLLGQGDRVALSEGLYGRTTTLVARELARFGVGHDLFDATRAETLPQALAETTRLVFIETLSNPLLRVADIAGLAATCRERKIPLAVDNTFAPLHCRPIALGADFVIHSGTKAIGGHSDVTLGLLVGRSTEIARLGPIASTLGLTGNPFDSWLALRGVATLAVRARQASANALELARRLEAHPATQATHYPGLESHPDHRLAQNLLSEGFGAMLTIDVGSRERANRLIQRLRHVPFAPSLGDVSTTLSHPTSTSHRSQTPQQWARQGITPGLVRLSVGIEAVGDLWADFAQALDGLDPIS
jgi:cystathionine beta-lyase/cystathionine gamma-synthase